MFSCAVSVCVQEWSELVFSCAVSLQCFSPSPLTTLHKYHTILSLVTENEGKTSVRRYCSRSVCLNICIITTTEALQIAGSAYNKVRACKCNSLWYGVLHSEESPTV